MFERVINAVTENSSPFKQAYAVTQEVSDQLNVTLSDMLPTAVAITQLSPQNVQNAFVAGIMNLLVRSVAEVLGVPADKMQQFYTEAGDKIMDVFDRAAKDAGCSPLFGAGAREEITASKTPKLKHYILASSYNDFRHCCIRLNIAAADADYIGSERDLHGKRLDVAVTTPGYGTNKAYDAKFHETLNLCCGGLIAEHHYDPATRADVRAAA